MHGTFGSMIGGGLNSGKLFCGELNTGLSESSGPNMRANSVLILLLLSETIPLLRRSLSSESASIMLQCTFGC